VLGSACHNGLHQLTACRPILRCRVNRNWTNARNRSSLVQTVASDDSSVLFGHYTEKPRMRKHHREDADGNLGVGEILIKFVMIGEHAEGLKTYSSAYFGVGRISASNDK
jgi:hypothetical protein